MDPVPVWKGATGDEAYAYRQILVLKTVDSDGEPVRVVLLGSGKSMDVKDTVAIALVSGGTITERVQIRMPHRNGKLVPSYEQILWQSPEGEILAGASCYVFQMKTTRTDHTTS